MVSDLLFLLQKHHFWPYIILLWSLNKLLRANSIQWLVYVIVQCLFYIFACDSTWCVWARCLLSSLLTGLVFSAFFSFWFWYLAFQYTHASWSFQSQDLNLKPPTAAAIMKPISLWTPKCLGCFFKPRNTLNFLCLDFMVVCSFLRYINKGHKICFSGGVEF